MKPSLEIITADDLERYAKIGLDRADWYDKALAEIIGVCRRECWDVVDFARKIAILSPRVAIRRNIRLALTYQEYTDYLGGVVLGIKQSMSHYEKTDEIRGPKTGPFSDALLGDNEAIVLDTWMSKVMLPCEFLPDSSSFRRKATRAGAEEVIRKVAKRLYLSPRDCQAAIWSGVFREFGNKPQYFPVREEYDRWLAYDRWFPDGDIENSHLE